MSQAAKPRPPVVISLEAAAVKVLTSGTKQKSTEPTVDDPFTPSPNATRRRNMSMADMERVAEQLAAQPDAPEALPRREEPVRPPTGVVQTIPDAPRPTAMPVASESDILSRSFRQFIAVRFRMTLELKEAELSFPVIRVIKSKYSITVIVPLKTDEVACVPKPGTEVSLYIASGPSAMNEKAYYPGAYAELPELGLAIMTFIRSENADGKA